ncbi:MAG: alpha/beta hydrolase [Pseudomonadota bacterium]
MENPVHHTASLSLDPALFDLASVDDETREINSAVIARLAAQPDQWSLMADEVRERRAKGLGAFPPAPLSHHAETLEIPGPGGPIPLRLLRYQPQGDEAPGCVYLHIHGGGWTFGGADQQDPLLETLAREGRCTVVSVEYRLAPEHLYPAAVEDCIAAARWLISVGAAQFGTDQLKIGGESAGAHLSVLTLLALRDEDGVMPFSGANLVAGCYDLSMTPSARNFGDEKLVLRTIDVHNFVARFLKPEDRPRDSAISPLYADLTGLPDALFSVGTRDALLDDTLFMAARWMAAGNGAALDVAPGGAHVFQSLGGALAAKSISRMASFLRGNPPS